MLCARGPADTLPDEGQPMRYLIPPTIAAAALTLTGGALLHLDALRACPTAAGFALIAAGIALAFLTLARALAHPEA